MSLPLRVIHRMQRAHSSTTSTVTPMQIVVTRQTICLNLFPTPAALWRPASDGLEVEMRGIRTSEQQRWSGKII